MNDPQVVWLVDPQPTDREQARKALQEAFPQVVIREVATPEDWREVKAGPAPWGVVMESHLPWQDGLQVLQEVKGRTPFCPVVWFTRSATPEEVQQAFQSGLDGYLPKSPHHYALLPAVLQGALDRAAQRRALHTSEAHLRLLHRIDRHILSTHSFEEVSRQILPALLDLVGCSFAGIALFDLRRQTGKVLATVVRGKEAPPFTFQASPPEVVRRALREKEAHTWPVEEFFPHSPAYQEYFRQLNIQAITSIPLRAGDQVLGVLNLGWREQDDISPQSLRVAQQVAGQLAIALQTTRLLEEERRARHTAESLQRASLALSHTLDPKEVLRTLLDELAKQIPYASANVWLLEEGAWHAHALRGYRRFGVHERVARLTVAIEEWETFQIIQRTHQPLLIPDTQESPIWKHDPAMDYIRSWLGVPLIAGGRLMGIFSLDHTEPRGFTPEHVAVAEALAAPAAVALQNARLYRREARRRAELEALRQAALHLAGALELPQLLENLIAQIVSLTGSKDAHIFLYEQGKLTLGAAFYEGKLQPKPYSEPRLDGVTYTAARTGQEVLVPDARQSSFFQQENTWQGWGGSIISIPLKYGGQVVGVMNVAWPRPRGYTEDHLRLLRLLADHAAIAIYNARLLQEARQKTEQLEALYQTAHTLNTALDPTTVFQQVAQTARQLLPADAVLLFQIEQGQSQRLVCKVALGAQTENLLGLYLPARSGPLGEALQQRRALLVSQADQVSLWEKVTGALHGLRARSLLAVPLIAHGESLGVLVAINTESPRSFSPQDEELLVSLADHAAIALRNAMLVEDLRRRVEEMEVVTRLSAALRQAPDSHTIAQTLIREACHLVHAHSGIILFAVGEEASAEEGVQHLVLEGVCGLPYKTLGERLRVLAVSGPWYRLLRQSTPLVITGLSHPIYRSLAQWIEAWDLQASTLASVSLSTVDGTALGLLLLARSVGDPPFSLKELDLLQTVAEIGANALQRARAYENLEQTFLETVLALAQTIDVKDAYTGDHSGRLAEWALAVAEVLGLSETEKQHLHWAALLHDIGKIGIPDEILLKPGPLSAEEWAVMKRHPEIGADIIRRVQGLQPVAEIIAAHHERWDGSGYPKGLKGEEIPLGARILAVVDSYGAMVDERIYRKASTHQEALEQIRRNAGKLYDPRVVEAFVQVMKDGPPSPKLRPPVGPTGPLTLPPQITSPTRPLSS